MEQTHKTKEVVAYAFLNALGTATYVAAVASFLFYTSQNLRVVEPSVLIPISMLLLFVVSATITASLVLGRPILWYLDGAKRDAVSLLVATSAVLVIVACGSFFALYLMALA